MVREMKPAEIRDFIAFGDSLYENDPAYVPYLHRDLKKSLEILVFQKKTYRALLSFDGQGRVNGRILLTVGKSKQLVTEHCGYFSHFEAVDDQEVFDALMQAAEKTLADMGAEVMLGSFFPHDPDNRRGIVVQGFELPPTLFTSHNPPYYQRLFETYGFLKQTDALEYDYRGDAETEQRIREIAEKALRENDITISPLDFRHIDREIEDIHKIMVIASTQVIFEEVISKEKIRKIFEKWKMFINPDFGFIARRNSDGAPIGFTLSVLDYNEVIQKMHGKTDLRGILVFLRQRKHITGLRAMLQYIIPEYQHKGVSKALYNETRKSVEKYGIRRISLGTIMEKNGKSNGAITSLGGELSRVYRIYYKPIGENGGVQA